MTDDFILALQDANHTPELPEALEDVLGILERSTGQSRDLLISQALIMWMGVNKPLSTFAIAALQKYLHDSCSELLDAHNGE